MSRLLALFTALCLSIAAHAASSTFNSASGELSITEIGLAGEGTRYRDVTLKLVGLTAVYLNDPRATTFSLDPATAVLHLPTLPIATALNRLNGGTGPPGDVPGTIDCTRSSTPATGVALQVQATL